MTLDGCQRLVRRLAALSEPRQRVVVIAEEASRLGMEAFADLLAVLVARASESRSESAKISISAVMRYLDSDFLEDSDRAALLEACREGGHQQLMRLLFTPPSHRSTDSPKVPDYGSGRVLTLGERKSLARRPNRKVLESVLADPHPAVIKNLLRNPKLIERDVMVLASRRPNYEDVLQQIYESPKWSTRYKVKLALARNPYTPPTISLKLVPMLLRQHLVEMLDDRNLHPSVLVACKRFLEGEEPPPAGSEEEPLLH